MAWPNHFHRLGSGRPDKKLYKLDKQDLARQHLGREVTVKGKVDGNSIVVDSIAPTGHD